MPSEQPPTRVETCPTCGHDREVVTSDEGTSYFKPATPSEQPREGTRARAERPTFNGYPASWWPAETCPRCSSSDRNRRGGGRGNA